MEDADTVVPFEMLDEVYNAAKVEKEKLDVLGAGHGEVEKVDSGIIKVVCILYTIIGG